METGQVVGRDDELMVEAVEAAGPEDALVRRADWDGTWKRLVTSFPEQVLGQVCGLDVEGVEIVGLPTEVHRPMLPDLVFGLRVTSDGVERLVHLEVQAQSEPGFELRLATYFVLLAYRHKMVPHQVVIMPSGGPFTGQFALGPLSLEYQVVDVTTLDPGPLLDGPLAPLALWCAEHEGDAMWPAHVVEIVVQRIQAMADRDLQALLAQLVILNGEDATALLVEALERRTMSNLLENTVIGQRLREEGREAGREEGREEALFASLLVMLQERFGDVAGLERVAERLAADGDFRAGLRRIREAATADDILA